MERIPIENPEINILFVRDVHESLHSKNVELFVIEEVDTTYSIYRIPIFYQGYINDLYNRLAYDYDTLTIEQKEQYKNQYKHMKRNGNGTYYADTKTYTFTSKNNNKKSDT